MDTGVGERSKTCARPVAAAPMPLLASPPVRVAVVGFGCRVSASEAEAMAARLHQRGLAPAGIDDAELVVVHGCAITASAEADARALTRRVARRGGAQVIASGCWAHADGAAIAAMPGVLDVLDVRDADAAVTRVLAHAGREPLAPAPVQLSRRPPLAVLPPVVDARARALLKVQDGCDYACSFCIVPQLRGRSRSLPFGAIAAHVDGLVAAGVPEIVMTGVHLGTWGRDLGERGGVAGLVQRLLPHLGATRLRLSSIDPHELDDALIDLLARERGRLCRHLHLPVQSCDDGVLTRMRRAHRTGAFVERVQRAIDRVPGLAIATDVIAGHPGEDDDAFARTHDVLAALPLAAMHVFPYSPRPGTAAASMPDAVPASTIRVRAAQLRALSQQQQRRFRAAAIGTTLDVVSHRAPDRDGVLWAMSDHDLRVRLPGDCDAFGQRLRARLHDDGEAASLVP
ncbi:MAG: MiaB/RimO family radical SAM methylthiotransferase [Deltaproteobacteria bacterium]|nr:MiaB/RimO family radical SAM methylthiotransferase [Deltaproteobacteria bacterium]